jgi:hypothetical protein
VLMVTGTSYVYKLPFDLTPSFALINHSHMHKQ